MSTLLVMLLCVMAFAGLALATSRQQRELFGRPLSPAATCGLRASGWLGLLIALGLLVAGRGWAAGLVCYSGCTSLAAALVYLGLIIQARRTTPH